MNERTPRRTLGIPSATTSEEVPTAKPTTDYVSPFGSDATGHHPGCRPTPADDGTWLGYAERAAEALRSTVAGLRALTAGDGIDPDGAPAVALRQEAERLGRTVALCLIGYGDPATRNSPPEAIRL